MHTQISRRSLLLAAAAAPLATPLLAKQSPRWHDQGEGLAASGRDVVAYFGLSSRSDGVMGRSEFSTEHKGITFHFASGDNLETFLGAPDQYAPRYGGHCAFAMARDYFADGDPDAWTVHEDALYLNYSKLIRTRWLVSRDRDIRRGNVNWQEHFPGEV